MKNIYKGMGALAACVVLASCGEREPELPKDVPQLTRAELTKALVCADKLATNPPDGVKVSIYNSSKNKADRANMQIASESSIKMDNNEVTTGTTHKETRFLGTSTAYGKIYDGIFGPLDGVPDATTRTTTTKVSAMTRLVEIAPSTHDQESLQYRWSMHKLLAWCD